jgi:hypothetical protein
MSETVVDTKRRSFLRSPVLWIVGLVVALGVVGLGTTGYALAQGRHGHGPLACGPGHNPGRLLANPELAKKRLAFGAEWIVRTVGGTEEQKERARAIAVGLVDQIIPLAKEHQKHHQQFLEALSASTVDREALEQLRQAELALADTASRALVTAVADFSESLTPAQRTELRDLARRAHELHAPQAD